MAKHTHGSHNLTSGKFTKRKNRFVTLGLSDVTGIGPVLGNVKGRVHKAGQLFHKTRKPA